MSSNKMFEEKIPTAPAKGSLFYTMGKAGEDKPKSNINMQTSENYNEFNYFGGSNNILKL